jgi:hypothetical protein
MFILLFSSTSPTSCPSILLSFLLCWCVVSTSTWSHRSLLPPFSNSDVARESHSSFVQLPGSNWQFTL